MILPYRGRWPKIHETAFVAPSADIIGDVDIGAHSSIWFQVVIRGDVNSIRIGARTNIQDHSLLHVTRVAQATSQDPGSRLVIGDEVTIGHRVTLHGCTIGNRVLIGMGAIVMDEVEIGDHCLIGAGTLLTKGTKVPSGSLVVGSPGKVVRPLKESELKFLPKSAENYVGDTVEYHGYVPGPLLLGQDNADLEEFDVDLDQDLDGELSRKPSGDST